MGIIIQYLWHSAVPTGLSLSSMVLSSLFFVLSLLFLYEVRLCYIDVVHEGYCPIVRSIIEHKNQVYSSLVFSQPLCFITFSSQQFNCSILPPKFFILSLQYVRRISSTLLVLKLLFLFGCYLCFAFGRTWQRQVENDETPASTSITGHAAPMI